MPSATLEQCVYIYLLNFSFYSHFSLSLKPNSQIIACVVYHLLQIDNDISVEHKLPFI